MCYDWENEEIMKVLQSFPYQQVDPLPSQIQHFRQSFLATVEHHHPLQQLHLSLFLHNTTKESDAIMFAGREEGETERKMGKLSG